MSTCDIDNLIGVDLTPKKMMFIDENIFLYTQIY